MLKLYYKFNFATEPTEVSGPICIAGSIGSYEQLDLIKSHAPWSFTIGSAFFDNKFDGTFLEQINKVYDYSRK
ncbi:hypothetical protein RAL98_08780 [Staphylococcus sp. HKU1]|uniref:hypothetical protein n=1 Tax=Staphylococcus sp. HKU1 TaxID=3068989 RepID=UPI003AAF8CAF